MWNSEHTKKVTSTKVGFQIFFYDIGGKPAHVSPDGYNNGYITELIYTEPRNSVNVSKKE